jgi:trehalose 6-phosphate synthase
MGGIWMGWDGKSDGQEGASSTTITEVQGINLASVSLSRDEVRGFYDIFSNRTLCPILHGFPDNATISYDSYPVYRSVNRKYAASLIDMLEPGDLVWVQDYHLLPLGHELRKLGWTGRIGFFLHVPFPPPEIFGILPWARKLLTLLFDYDLVGLQTPKYVHNLQEALGDEFGAVLIADTVHHQGRTLKAHSFPVGAGADAFREMTQSQAPTPVSRFLENSPKGRQLLIGVDRLDYTKGIIQRMQSIERLFDDHPEPSVASLSSRSRRPAGSTSRNMPRNASDSTHSSARSTASSERSIGCPSILCTAHFPSRTWPTYTVKPTPASSPLSGTA